MRISDWSSDVCSSDLWPDERRQFAYLPLQHSEDRDDQRESLRLFHQLADPTFHDYAQKHFDMIDRFGRFPPRNAALGRAPRPEEAAAIAAGRPDGGRGGKAGVSTLRVGGLPAH